MNWIRYYLSNWYNSQNSLGLILLIKELRAGQTANTLSYAAVKLLTSSWMSKLASSCQPALTLRYRLTFSFFFFFVRCTVFYLIPLHLPTMSFCWNSTAAIHSSEKCLLFVSCDTLVQWEVHSVYLFVCVRACKIIKLPM